MSSPLTRAAARSHIDRTHPRRRAALRTRLALVVRTLEQSDVAGDASTDALLRRFENQLASADDSSIWLALAVLGVNLPETDEVVRTRRAIVLDGVFEAFRAFFEHGVAERLRPGDAHVVVEVLVGAVVVDVEHTARTELATGIQRVTREVVRRWDRDHDIVLVGWSPGARSLRRLLPAERERALTGHLDEDPARQGQAHLVVPWRGTYLLPELAPEHERTIRLSALARFSRSHTGVIGYDCIPISSAETTDANVSEAFAGFLAAVRYMDRVATISEACATEYRGWLHMLSAIGIDGPSVEGVLLPAQVGTTSAKAEHAARERLVVGTLPMVLVVGTHEPRKNHLAVLEAARQLWAAGHRFSLAFIGGHSWSSDKFEYQVRSLQREGYAVESVLSVSDEMLWAAYRLAHLVVFPSLNEGFGLPAAESLATGTPVITSDFGSMREVAADGGALLVDPHDDAAIAAAMGSVLSDPAVHARLCAEAEARPKRDWDTYAAEVWDHLVGKRQ